MKKIFFYSCLVLVAIASCQLEESSGLNSDRNTNLSYASKESRGVKNQLIESGEGKASYGDIRYNAVLISALEFIKRRGEIPATEDLEQLQKEHVLVLEIEDINALQGTQASKKLLLDEQELNSYMMFGILNDLNVVQGEEEYYAHSVHYDKDFAVSAGGNKLRAFLFFNDLKGTENTEIKYYDRLFGAGEIKL